MIRSAICAQCGHSWLTNQKRHDTEWCTPECTDRWMDAHPDEKLRRKFMTRDDCVDRMFERLGMMPPPRGPKMQGGN